MLKTQGIHHITAIVGDPQENVDFYGGTLELRLIKQTVNFDDPQTYHLYFGNEEADPGTLITFFPWPGADSGKIGDGQLGVTRYAIPKKSRSYWQNKLTKSHVSFEVITRFNDEVIAFSDPHGLKIELVEREESSSHHILGFDGGVLYSLFLEDTLRLLETMGFEKVAWTEDTTRLKSFAKRGNLIDVKRIGKKGLMGVGTVHHIAWRAKNDEEHLSWQTMITESGYRVTPIINRDYFKSIYFRERGNILFEIATDGPGFTIDEPFENLGEALRLPKKHAHLRQLLEKTLPKITTPKERDFSR